MSNRTHDPRPVEAPPAYPGKRPSQEMEEYWIYAHSSTRAAHPPTERCGKWMLFIHIENLDAVWATIHEGIRSGVLGPSAKTATMRPNPNAQTPDVKLICVYTSDGDDVDDVLRVLRALRTMLSIDTSPLYWKADSTTLAGEYGGRGKPVSRYAAKTVAAGRDEVYDRWSNNTYTLRWGE
jgi:hypothetical protein